VIFSTIAKTRFASAIVIFAYVLAGCQSNPDAEKILRAGYDGPGTELDAPLPELEPTLRLFESMAFQKWKVEEKTSRFTQPIRISTDSVGVPGGSDLAGKTRRYLEQWAGVFTGLLGLPVTVLPDGDLSGNMRVRLENASRVSGGGICNASYPKLFENAMHQGFVRIPAKAYDPSRAYRGVRNFRSQERNLNRCIAHEFLHAFGFWRHAGSIGMPPSVMAVLSDSRYGDHPWSLTIGDRIALKTLYHPRIKPNMTKEEAMPIAREVMAEIMQDRDALFPEVNGITVPLEDTAAPDRAEAQAFLESTIDEWRPKLAQYLGVKVYKRGAIYESEVHQLDVTTVEGDIISAWVGHNTRRVICDGGPCVGSGSQWTNTWPRMVHFRRSDESVSIDETSF